MTDAETGQVLSRLIQVREDWLIYAYCVFYNFNYIYN